MTVKLLKCDNIEMIDSALSQCYDQKKHIKGFKAQSRIEKVCNVYKHDSLLEFGSAIWEITASTKVLLEQTRHRHSSYAVKSSRYTLNKSELVFETTDEGRIDMELDRWKETVEDMIKLGFKNDVVSLMLPQCYQYKWQVQMNFRAMKNYFSLRLDPHAHFQIREVSEEMLDLLPDNIQDLVNS